MFSLATAIMFAAPRPFTPMMPIFNFSLGERLWALAERSATAKPAPAKAELLKKSRRLVCRFIIKSSDCEGEGGGSARARRTPG